MGNISNVSLGTARISVNGTDVGYTQGGVQLTFNTTMRETVIDHFGTITRNSIVQDQSVSVSFTMVESQAKNLYSISGNQPNSMLGNQIGQSFRVGTITIYTAKIGYALLDVELSTITIDAKSDSELSYAFQGKASLVTEPFYAG